MTVTYRRPSRPHNGIMRGESELQSGFCPRAAILSTRTYDIRNVHAGYTMDGQKVQLHTARGVGRAANGSAWQRSTLAHSHAGASMVGPRAHGAFHGSSRSVFNLQASRAPCALSDLALPARLLLTNRNFADHAFRTAKHPCAIRALTGGP